MCIDVSLLIDRVADQMDQLQAAVVVIGLELRSITEVGQAEYRLMMKGFTSLEQK
jgi:hypothetical protein